MTTIHRDSVATRESVVHTTDATGTRKVIDYSAAAIRLSMGFVFLWAFFDKAFGLGHETVGKDSWINGGSPSKGFLGFAATGPFKGFYNSLAGQPWVDVLFMVGLLAIGSALVLGVAMRIAAASGALLLVMMWSVTLPPANNLFMDDHLIYAMVLVLITALGAGATAGLGTRWSQLPIVQRAPWLR